MDSTLLAEEVIGKSPGAIPREMLIALTQTETIGANFLQQRASTTAERAIAANRIAQVSLNLESDLAAVTRPDIRFHQHSQASSIEPAELSQ